MSREMTQSSFIVITLVMLFISGCWTLATIMPYPIEYWFRAVMIAAVTASNVSFLLSLLTSALSYAGIGQDQSMRRLMIILFTIGVSALVVSVILFSISTLTGKWYSYD